MNSNQASTAQPIMHLSYHQGYDSIYNASYEFGFVFVDEDELEDDDDTEFENDVDDDALTLH